VANENQTLTVVFREEQPPSAAQSESAGGSSPKYGLTTQQWNQQDRRSSQQAPGYTSGKVLAKTDLIANSFTQGIKAIGSALNIAGEASDLPSGAFNYAGRFSAGGADHWGAKYAMGSKSGVGRTTVTDAGPPFGYSEAPPVSYGFGNVPPPPSSTPPPPPPGSSGSSGSGGVIPPPGGAVPISPPPGGGGGGGGGDGGGTFGGNFGKAFGAVVPIVTKLFGPAGIAVALTAATLGVAFKTLGDTIRAVDSMLQDLSETGSAFSAELAMAVVGREINEMFARMEQAQELSGPLSEYQGARSGVDRALIKIETSLVKGILPLATQITEDISAILRAIEPLINLIGDNPELLKTLFYNSNSSLRLLGRVLRWWERGEAEEATDGNMEAQKEFTDFITGEDLDPNALLGEARPRPTGVRGVFN